MKTLTIQEPWATLIINDIKKYEFRSWKTNYRGKILIHAGLTTNKLEKERLRVKETNNGYILGTVEIVECLKIDNNLKNKLLQENKELYKNAKVNEYAWVLKNPIKISPIKVKGKLGLWTYEMNNDKII